MKKRISDPNRIPGLLMYLRGRWDSRKGPTVVNTAISKMILRYRAYEFDQTVETDRKLYSIRDNAAKQLAILAHEEEPNNTLLFEDSSLTSIRERRRQKDKALSERQERKNALYEIIHAHETITEEHAVLQQEIASFREKLEAKLQDYIRGVRSGDLPEYICDKPIEGSKTAFGLYSAQHAYLDDLIRTTAERAQKGA